MICASQTDYIVVNRIGTILYTSPHLDLARKWARKNARFHSALRVEEREVMERRRRIYSEAQIATWAVRG